MTPDDLTEWQYRYDERVAICCGSDDPSPEIHKIAIDEADAWLEKQRAE